MLPFSVSSRAPSEFILSRPKIAQLLNSDYVRPLRVGICACEVSGDALGAVLMKKWRALCPHVCFIGVGGMQMEAQGLVSVAPFDSLGAMGLVEVMRHLPTLSKIKRQMIRIFDQESIDIFIGIDAPDFNLRLARKMKSRGCFCVQYVSPSVWAWRAGRIYGIKAATDLVLCLFEFETHIYQAHEHPSVCVGHPLLQLPIPKQMRTNTLALLPGSRLTEIHANLPTLLGAVRHYLSHAYLVGETPPDFVLPLAKPNLAQPILELFKVYGLKDHIALVDDAKTALSCARCALVVSGTATLLALACDCPMAVVYRTHPATYQIAKRLVKTPYIALPNILANAPLVGEYVQGRAQEKTLARQMHALYHQKSLQDAQRIGFDKIRQKKADAVNEAKAVLDAYLKRETMHASHST